MTLFLKHRWQYIAIKRDCHIVANIGAISLTPVNCQGVLNFKDDLRRILNPNPAQFQPSLVGRLQGGGDGGTGYIGWLHCGSVSGAIAFITQQVPIEFCPAGSVITTASGAVIPCPEIDDIGRQCDQKKRRIEEMLHNGMTVNSVIFRGGGTFPIPPWFQQWCEENNIEIIILDNTPFEQGYPPEIWTDKEGRPYTP